jgi:hypothetical protein
MKRKHLTLSLGCLLLFTVSGCRPPRNGAVKIVKVGVPPPTVVEAGGNLEFTSADFSFTVSWPGPGNSPCVQSLPIQGSPGGTAICTIRRSTAEGSYTFIVTQQPGPPDSGPPTPPMPIQTYIKRCNPPCK